ncbi:hypothetical protein [Verrucomicrobium spinosum]|uniref:hypothetical protein n=1 Tax=Verrucomicrobium spinosum TaxID=2736 RepID=UPI0001745BF3|nr:hypothetical protein [Verrucomicrobium spinosum]
MLFPLLAEALPQTPPVDSGFFKDWISMAVFVGGLALAIYGRFASRKVSVEPNPVQVQVQTAPAFATAQQHADLVERMDRFETTIGKAFDDLKKSRSEDIQNLHRHMDSVAKSVEEHTKEISRLHQDSIKTAFDRINEVSDQANRTAGAVEMMKQKGARSS